jgi:hypothetical protein
MSSSVAVAAAPSSLAPRSASFASSPSRRWSSSSRSADRRARSIATSIRARSSRAWRSAAVCSCRRSTTRPRMWTNRAVNQIPVSSTQM